MILVLFCVIVPIVGSIDVQIVGLFPKDNQHEERLLQPNNMFWCQHCVPMFRAAITIANQRGIHIENSSISGAVLKTIEDGHGFDALDQLCQLINKETVPDVIGIVGPSSSSEARLLGPFTARIGLPLVSYAATAADLSDTQLFPTFYRTISSDEYLAKAIVQLFAKFGWETCSVIFQKDDYGYGGVRVLSEKFGTELMIKERLAFDASSNEFNCNLTKTLRHSRSRIVLVWANDSTTTRIIQHALQAGLIGGSYVWVTTDEIDLEEFTSRSQWHLLEGLLTVTHMNKYLAADGTHPLLQEALTVWRNSSLDNEKIPGEDEMINPYAMFVFDATWALIAALNKSTWDSFPRLIRSSSHCFNSTLENKNQYHQHLRETNFSGVSGHVQFPNNISNNRVGGAIYVLKNLRLKKISMNQTNEALGYKNLMMWNEANPKWINVNNSSSLSIKWPNKSSEVPSEHPRIRGERLRILVIESPPFVIVRNRSSELENEDSLDNFDQFTQDYNFLNTNDTDLDVYGFAAELIHELHIHMGFTYTIDIALPETPYHRLVSLLAENESQWDVIIADVTITSNRLQTVDFSTAIHENAVRVIIRDNPSLFTFDLFCFLSPFSSGVWIILLLIVIYSGVLIYLFERWATPKDEKNTGLRALAIGVCHALSSVVSMSGDLPLTTMSSRMMTIGLYTLSVILVATYTANLSSYLTLQRTLPAISGIDDIKNGRLPFSRIGIVHNSAIADYYQQNISSLFYPIPKSQDIFSLLLSNRIDAALWDSIALEYAIEKYYCGRLVVVGIGFAKSSFGIAMRKSYEYKADFDMSIVSFREKNILDELEQKCFRPKKCTTSFLLSNSNNDAGGNERGKIPVDIVGGLFPTFFIVSLIATALHVWNFRLDIARNIRRCVKQFRQRVT